MQGSSGLLLMALLLAASLTSGCDFVRGYAGADATMLLHPLAASASDSVEEAKWRFMFDGFGSLDRDPLETSALPWKLVAAALALDESQPTSMDVSAGAAHEDAAVQQARLLLRGDKAEVTVGELSVVECWR